LITGAAKCFERHTLVADIRRVHADIGWRWINELLHVSEQKRLREASMGHRRRVASFVADGEGDREPQLYCQQEDCEMKHATIGLLGIAIACLASVTDAHADTCSYGGTNYTCETICTNNCTSRGVVVFSTCDSNPYGNGDGTCVICGNGSANTIYGSTGRDLICSKGANDTVFGDTGDDTIVGDAGDDAIDGEGGNDLIDGGNGNDVELEGGDGDDVIIGGAGTDLIRGGAGNDALNGGTGGDLIYGDGAPLGDVLCGGDGDDALLIDGTGYHCLDGGKDQTTNGSGLGFDCGYDADNECTNAATARNCAFAFAWGEIGFDSSTRSCNCQ
jgi:hypothetical protein